MERKMIALMGDEGQVLSVKNALLLDGNVDVRLVPGYYVQNNETQLNDKGTIAGQDYGLLISAFENCYGVFIAHAPGHNNVFATNEVIIDAAAEAGVAHVIYAMPAFQHVSDFGYQFPYHQIKKALKAIEENRPLKVSVIRTPVFYEQFISPEILRFNDDGDGIIAAIHFGKKLPAAALNDLGFVVRMMFRYTDCYSQRIVGLVGDQLAYEDYLQQLYVACGMNTVNGEPPPFCFRGPEDMFLGGVAFSDVPLSFLPDSIESYGLHPGMQPFPRWLKRNLRNINIQLAAIRPPSRARRRA